MSKRKVNRRQAWRIEKVQEERRARAARKEALLQSTLQGSELGPEQGGLLIASHGAALEIEDEAGTVRRCLVRQHLGLPVVGDRVVWQATSDGGGVVTALLPRHSLLARLVRGEPKPLAANVDQILVVTAPRPHLSRELLDQYLVAAEQTGIEPVILFNKVDLLDAQEALRFRALFDIYRHLGYCVLEASTREQHGLDPVRSQLAGRTSVFVGQSGVGKSSLVQVLLPEQEIAVGELSSATDLGRHTTSAARLYHLPSGGAIIDSPGVRDFRLGEIDRHGIAAGFREIAPLLGHCRFRDCHHQEEPECALRAAVAEGSMAPERLESYLHIVERLERAWP